MRKAVWILVVLLSFSVLAWGADVKVAKVQQPSDIPSFVGYAPNKIVVKFDDSILKKIDQKLLQKGKFGVPALDKIGDLYDVTRIRQQFPGAQKKFYRGKVVDLSGWHKVFFRTEVDVEKVVEAFKQVPGVIDAQPIGIHTVYGVPNDPNFADQWHLDQANDADIDAPEAWDIETGNSDIIAAVLDTGVRYFHKDLGGANASYDNPENARGNMWINWAEKNGTPGVDDDGNGYVDDWIGWDFVANESSCWSGEDCTEPDNDPRDFNGHGTHVAGIIAAINNNGYAVASPAGGWANGSQEVDGNGVKIMALRIGWSGRFFIFEVGYVSMDYAAEALYYAADNGARLANCSWGSSNTGGLGDALDYFIASGGLVFKAAGNDDLDDPDYMGNRADIINVAATDANDCKASFSNYGAWVDISAPGDNITSTYHEKDDPQNDYIATISGTSMASPLALSVAALIWSQNPTWSADQVKQHLYDTADDIYTLSCNSAYQGKLGAGRVNAFNAVNAGGGPGAPTADFTASPTSGCAPLTVSFTDQSTGDITSWSWDFGDGNTSTEQNPTHTYTAAGTYTVSLTVTGPGGSDTETKVDYIAVYDTPVADFVGSPTSGDAPLTVDFTDQSTGNPTSWNWDFGDGNTSTAQNPTHTYNNPGTYTVTLTVSNDCGSDQVTKVDYITVTEPPQQTMHVNNMEVIKEYFWFLTRGRARVQIVDASGNPVADATVQGEWTEGASGTAEFTTGSDGWGETVSSWYWSDPTYTFCVTDVIKTGWTYDAAANNMTCASSDGSTSAKVASLTSEELKEIETSLGHKLHYNYPNPFNPSTTINFFLPEAAHVRVEIYNALGERVATLLDGPVAAGAKSVVWNGKDNSGNTVGSGFYFYRITINNEQTFSRKMLLMK